MSESIVSEVQSEPTLRVPLYHRPVLVVGAITVLGLVLRLMFLSSPALWIDETAAYRRVSGNFSELLESLRETGFTPLHYLLYWGISRVVPMTPWVMRLPTALAGAAMVPAMYWLAVQLVSRRTAVVAALLTATSAYLLNYSRDAKMYVECWLFVTISSGCLLWWLRSNRWIAWFFWVLAGLMMVGFHATAAMVLPVQIIIFATHSKPKWLRIGLFILGLLIVAGAMVAYYELFSHYYERSMKNWGESGLSWIEGQNFGLDGFGLVRYAGTHFLYGWEWSAPFDTFFIDPAKLKLYQNIATAFFVIFMIGMIPWRKNAGNGVNWRSLLWLGFWLVIPVYATYCTSTDSRMAPWEWFGWIARFPYVAAAMVILFLSQLLRGDGKRKRLMNLLIPLVTLSIVLIACMMVYWTVPVQPSSVWKPRYMGIVWPAMGIAVAALIMRLPTWPIRGLVISAFIVVNLYRHNAFLFYGSEPPTELIARDILESDPRESTIRTYIGRRCLSRVQFGPADNFFTPTMPYYLYVFSSTSTTPLTYNQDWLTRFRIFKSTLPLGFYVPTDIRRNPQIKKIIVWDDPQLNKNDPLLGQLGIAWKLESQEDFPLWDRWRWRQFDTFQRRIYRRD